MSTPLFDPSIKKKKKSTKSKPAFALDEESASASKEGSPAPEVAGLDLNKDAGVGGEFEFKKKKKKAPGHHKAADDFDAQLQAAGLAPAAGDAVGGAVAVSSSESGNPVPYEELLHRFFEILREQNPEMANDRSGVKYKIPPPVVQREGNKKTAFANIKAIADKMHRPTEHVIHFLFTELGTSGSVDGAQRLVIKGRFQQKQLEGVLRRYILEYVTCKTCKSVNTRLTKENRLYFLDCNSCGSRRSVQSIKAGYQAVTRQARQRAKA